MTQLAQRNKRIQRRLTKGDTNIDYTGYVQLLLKQRLTYPNEPKVYAPFGLSELFLLNPPSLDITISKVLNSSYIYTGVVRSNNLLYSLQDPLLADIKYKRTLYYYEFVRVYSDFHDLASWRYSYVPVLLLDKVKTKLPKIITWNTTKLVNTFVEYPSGKHILNLKEININASLPEIDHFIKATDVSHPFLPKFFFTGLSYQWGDATTVYEYFDSVGYYGIQDALYLSNLRPNIVNYPLGQVFNNDLIENSQFNHLLDSFPSEGSVPWYGNFTGYTTSPSYSKDLFYFYQNKDSSFLSLAPPHPQVKTALLPYINNI